MPTVTDQRPTNRSICKRCGATIEWYRTVKGKRMPVDPSPTTEGNVKVDPDGSVEVLGGFDLMLAHSAGELLHLSHFVTCKPGGHRG